MENLAKALAKVTGWKVNEGDDLQKTVAIYALNSVSYILYTIYINMVLGGGCIYV